MVNQFAGEVRDGIAGNDGARSGDPLRGRGDRNNRGKISRATADYGAWEQDATATSFIR